MRVTIKPGRASGVISAPPSKSMAHRLLICAGLSKGESVVRGVSECEDVLATIDCLKALGISCVRDGDTVRVKGRGLSECEPNTTLFCRESGSTLRFFLPLCLLCGKEVSLSGAPYLLQRPMSVYEDICRKKGIEYKKDSDTITVKGPIPSGEYSVVGNISSQFISGLLFALPLAKGNSTIKIKPPIESRSYIELTRSALAEFGVEVLWADENTLFIRGDQHYTPKETTVEGDYSNAAFLDALNLLGGRVSVCGLDRNSLQGDAVYKEHFRLLSEGTPTIHIGDCPDLGPVLFAMAAAKNGGRFEGTKRLRIKESDRATVMAEELRKFGAEVSVYDDTVVVTPCDLHAPTATLDGHNDHRIVMALTLLLTLTGGSIDGAEAVSKSFPEFFEALRSLGLAVDTEEI